jgi:hypothetical protein
MDGSCPRESRGESRHAFQEPERQLRHALAEGPSIIPAGPPQTMQHSTSSDETAAIKSAFAVQVQVRDSYSLK